MEYSKKETHTAFTLSIKSFIQLKTIVSATSCYTYEKFAVCAPHIVNVCVSSLCVYVGCCFRASVENNECEGNVKIKLYMLTY